MFEVACASHEHADAEFVGFDYAVVVADTAARLNDSGYTILSCQSHSIIKWQEAVRSEDKTFGHTCCVGLLHSNLGTTYAVHLTCTYAQRLTVLNYYYRIGFHVLNDIPTELHVCECSRIRLHLSSAHIGCDSLDLGVEVLHKQTAVHA